MDEDSFSGPFIYLDKWAFIIRIHYAEEDNFGSIFPILEQDCLVAIKRFDLRVVVFFVLFFLLMF